MIFLKAIGVAILTFVGAFGIVVVLSAVGLASGASDADTEAFVSQTFTWCLVAAAIVGFGYYVTRKLGKS